MKKTTLLLGLVLFLTNVYAQMGKTSIGFQGGVSFISQKLSQDGLSTIFETDNGITFGLLLDQPLGNHFSFQTGLSYVSKGSISRHSYNNIQSSNTFKLKYIELPVSLILKSGNNNCGLFAGIGAAASYGVDASVVIDRGQGNVQKVSYSFGNGNDDVFKQFDLGAYFQAGIQFRCGLLLSANYYLGVSNIINSDDQSKLTNRYWAIKLGFLFNNR